MTKQALQAYNPNDIAIVTVFKDSSAIKMMGQAAKYGLIYIETKKFARFRYWQYFKSKSEQYAELVPTSESDTNIQYILNKKVLKDNFEGDLAQIDDKVFKSLQIITEQQLIKDYNVTDKRFGVIILSSTSSDLRNGK